MKLHLTLSQGAADGSYYENSCVMTIKIGEQISNRRRVTFDSLLSIGHSIMYIEISPMGGRKR